MLPTTRPTARWKATSSIFYPALKMEFTDRKITFDEKCNATERKRKKRDEAERQRF